MKWSAQRAGVEDIAKCGLKGSPTIVKRVFAPAPRAEKAVLIDIGRPTQPAEALIEEIFKRQPSSKPSSSRWRADSEAKKEQLR